MNPPIRRRAQTKIPVGSYGPYLGIIVTMALRGLLGFCPRQSSGISPNDQEGGHGARFPSAVLPFLRASRGTVPSTRILMGTAPPSALGT